jgi:hypothetical protein
VTLGRLAHALVVAFAVYQLRGAIVSADQGHLRVRHASGQIVELLLDDQTVFLRGRERVTVDALQSARRIVGEVQPFSDGRQRAVKVHLYGRR